MTADSDACLRMVIHGLCGLRLETCGISFRPTVPKGMSPVAVYELPTARPNRESTSPGEDQQVRSITINGKEARTLPTTAKGKQVVRIEMVDAANERGPRATPRFVAGVSS